jgi:hypothetical protein
MVKNMPIKTCPKYRRYAVALLVGGLTLAARGPGGAQTPLPPVIPAWSATGMLLESCTCAVPCTCNFGQGPSPHAYCYAVYAYRLDKADYNGVDLSGLVVAGADGPKGVAGFLDDRVAAAKRPALESLARLIFAAGGPSGGPRRWTPTNITDEVQGDRLRLMVAGHGGFTADMLLGRDGKTPIIVENNPVWPIHRSAKAKSRQLTFHDEAVGAIDGDGTNANYGAFTLGSAEKKDR